MCAFLLTHPNSKQVDARALLAVLRIAPKVGVDCREGRLRVLLWRKGDARAAVGAVLPRYKRTCMAVPQRAEAVRWICERPFEPWGSSTSHHSRTATQQAANVLPLTM